MIAKAAKHSQLLRSSGALLVNLLALLLAYLLEPEARSSSLVVFMGAVAFSAWYGGRLAGLGAVAFATWATSYPMLSGEASAVDFPVAFLRLCAFAAVSLLVSAVNAARAAERAREAAARRQQWVQSVLDLQPTPLLLISSDTGDLVSANRAAMEMKAAGFPIEALARGDAALADAKDPVSAAGMPVVRATRGERVQAFQMRWQAADGERLLLVNASSLASMHEHPATVIVSLQDVTELKRVENRLRQSEARYRALSEAAPVGVIYADAAGSCRYVNDRWCEMAGLLPAEVLDDGWIGAVHPEDRGAVSDMWHSLALTDGRSAREYRLVRADKSVRWVVGHTAPLRDDGGAAVGYIGTITDITAQKQAQEALRALAEASAALAASANGDAALENALRLVLPHLGDWCVIDLAADAARAEDSATPRTRLVVHRDWRQEALLRRLVQAAPPHPAGVPEQPTFFASLSDIGLHARRDPGAPEPAVSLDPQRGVALPVIIGGRAQGKLIVGMAAADAQSTKARIVFAAEVARRMAIAAENARLLSEVRAAERQLRHQLDFTGAIIGSLGEGLCAVDPDGMIIFVNPAAVRLLGRSEAELLGNRLTELLQPADASLTTAQRDEWPLVLAVCRGEPLRSREYLVQRPDGTAIPVEVGCSPIHTEGRTVGAVLAFTDITEQKREEEALERLAQQRAHLVSTVSHALRAPIAAMLVNLEVLGDGTLGELTQEQKEFVTRATNSATGLGKTVDDLLTLARLQDGRVRLERETFHVADELRAVYLQMLPRAQSRNVTLALDVEPTLGALLTDRRQLSCVVTELLENAIKYSGPGGRVRVTALGTARSVWIQVADTGPGIDRDDMPHIFEPFYRGAAAERHQTPGSGLGLQIVKQTTALLGGRIRVRRGPGGGALFEVVLPRRPRPARARNRS